MDPSVHNRVRELRQSRNWTQEHLAAEAGVSRQSMNSIERGRYIPSLPLALALAEVFAIPVEQLFSLTPFPATGGSEAAPESANPDPNNSSPENEQ